MVGQLTLLFSGLVADKKVDFAPSIFGVRQNRAKAVDYLMTNNYVAHGWFFIKDPRNTYDWTFFFQPLYIEAWIGLVIFSFFAPLFIAIIARFRKLFIVCNKNNLSVLVNA